MRCTKNISLDISLKAKCLQADKARLVLTLTRIILYMYFDTSSTDHLRWGLDFRLGQLILLEPLEAFVEGVVHAFADEHDVVGDLDWGACEAG